MYRSLARTLEITVASWRVLRGDGLMLFPLAMGFCLVVALLYVLVAFQYGGTFGRIAGGFDVLVADFILLGLAYLGASFVIVYFTAAMVASLHYAMTGGTPDFRFGLEAANDRLGALAIWCLIGATLGPTAGPLASRPGFIGRFGRSLANAMGGWATSLVVPVMMVENAAPPAAMGRSSEMFIETWGRAPGANHGYGPLYLGVLIAAMILGGGLLLLGASAGVSVVFAVITFALSAGVLKCLETVFVVALYNYSALGESDGSFPVEWLRDAYGAGSTVLRSVEADTEHRAAA